MICVSCDNPQSSVKPVLNCSNAHFLCHTCFAQNFSCPLCRNELRWDSDHLNDIPNSEIQIGKIIGEGGSATVYEAHWYGKEVALKAIRLSNDKESRKLKQELKTLINLNHPSILRVFGLTYLEGDRLSIVMEKGSGTVKVPSILSYQTLRNAIDVVHGLIFLHSRQTIHGDLKPQNILLVNSEIKLCDFGTAKLLSNNDTNTLRFTPKYAGIEVFDEKVCPESDVYSLGVILFEMLCGEIAFKKLNQLALIKAKMNNPEFSFPQDTPQSLESIIIDCCHPDPQRRPSLGRILSVLENLQGYLSSDVSENEKEELVKKQRIQISNLETKIEKLEFELSNVDSSMQHCESGLSDVQIEEPNSTISQLQSELDAKNAQIAALLDKLDSRVTQNTQVKEQKSKLESELSLANNKIKELELKLKTTKSPAVNLYFNQLVQQSCFGPKLISFGQKVQISSPVRSILSGPGVCLDVEDLVGIPHLLLLIETLAGTTFGGYLPKGFGCVNTCSSSTFLFRLSSSSSVIFPVKRTGISGGFCLTRRLTGCHDLELADRGKGVENLGAVAYQGNPGELVPERKFEVLKIEAFQCRVEFRK
ncbi:hypothetical protein P9112_002916 [Eukaryota sp. TZLM1-RC]